MQKNLDETNENVEEKYFFHLFKVDINALWNYFINPSFIATYFHDNCKVTNIKNLKKLLQENDIVEQFYPDLNIKSKLLIEKIIDTQNFKSISLRLLDYPKDITPFAVNNSFYFCSHTHVTGLQIKLTIFDKTKSNFMLDYFYKNEELIYRSIDKYMEINFRETEETESISIRKNYDVVFDFITKNNYTNLKILLGNNASVKYINSNEIEVEHFTKKNKVQFRISTNKEFNEKHLILQPFKSEIQIPRQLIIIKIININKDDCLVMFIHKLKEYVTNDIINNYSILKKKLLWLLKSTIESN